MPNLTEILRDHYERHPEQTALVMLQAVPKGSPEGPLPGMSERLVSYRDLLAGANAYARTFAAAGLQPDEVVVLILQHSFDLVCAFYGAILAGAIPAIMPFLTEKLLPERYRADLAALVSVTRPAAIVTYPEFEGEVQAALSPTPGPSPRGGEKENSEFLSPLGDKNSEEKTQTSVRAVIVCDRVEAPSAPDFDSLPGLQRSPGDTVLLQHSSGTTGLQKGVALSHQAVLNQLAAYSAALHLTPQDVIVSWLPLYHDMGLIAGFLMPILAGNRLVIMSPFDWVRSPVRLLQAVSHYQGTLSWLPNFAYNFCATKIRERDLEGLDLSSWRSVSNCSEPMRYESHKAFYQRLASRGLRFEALNTCYAMAENVFAVTQGGVDGPVTVDEIDRQDMQVNRLARPALSDDGHPTIKMLSAGRPVTNTECQVVDEKGQPVPERTVGEIALRSDCMLSGYYHRPDATAKAFVDGWYLTGDYGYMADGEVYVAGRKKDLIIVGGKNVYPQDLELLAMEVPGVHAGRVSAFGIYNDEAGTEDVVIVAEVDTTDPDEREAIARGIEQAINRGSAIRLRDCYIVAPPWIVKTSSGKTARLANKEKYLQELDHGGTEDTEGKD
jgi:fatty-acyl-CoA synthase